MKKNRFEHLRIDTKEILPAPYYNYPVLQNNEFETLVIAFPGDVHKEVDLRVGLQDNVWTLGYSVFGSSCNPGRKWGQFTSKKDALLYGLGIIEARMLDIISPEYGESFWSKSDCRHVLKEAQKRMFTTVCVQLELFE